MPKYLSKARMEIVDLNFSRKREYSACLALLKCSKKLVTAALACHQISANTSVTHHRTDSQVKHFKMIGVSAKDLCLLDSSVLRFQVSPKLQAEKGLAHVHILIYADCVCRFKTLSFNVS